MTKQPDDFASLPKKEKTAMVLTTLAEHALRADQESKPRLKARAIHLLADCFKWKADPIESLDGFLAGLDAEIRESIEQPLRKRLGKQRRNRR